MVGKMSSMGMSWVITASHFDYFPLGKTLLIL